MFVVIIDLVWFGYGFVLVIVSLLFGLRLCNLIVAVGGLALVWVVGSGILVRLLVFLWVFLNTLFEFASCLLLEVGVGWILWAC